MVVSLFLLVPPVIPCWAKPPEVSFEIRHDGSPLIIPVLIAGKECSFIMDTGSSHSCIDRSLNFLLGGPVRRVAVATLNSPEVADLCEAPPMQIRGLPFANITEVLRVDLSGVRAVSGYNILGIIGMDVLKDRVIALKFDEGRMVIGDVCPKGCGTPIGLVKSTDGTYLLPGEMAGSAKCLFTLDTGDVGLDAGSINSETVRLLCSVRAARMAGRCYCVSVVTGKSTTQQIVRSREFTMGPFAQADVAFSESESSTLGLEYLSRYSVTIDFPHQTVYLKPGKRYDEPYRTDLSGAHLVRDSGATIVYSVDRQSIGERAGLKARDRIAAFDGHDANTMTLFEMRRALSRDGRRELLVMRGDVSVRLVLELRAEDRKGSNSY